MSPKKESAAQFLIEKMTPTQQARAERVDSVLPALRASAASADAKGEFPPTHVQTFKEVGLLGLMVPAKYGGLGGDLVDLTSATFAMGTACPSTALSYFFHNSSVSRGLLALEAVAAGKFSDEEAPIVHAFGENVLYKMGRDGRFLGNFASESVKSSQSSVFISSEASPVNGGWLLNGVKSFGCNTGVANAYLVMAKIAGIDGADGLGLFFVPANAEGVSERDKWNALGMRATASQGIIMKDVFVPELEALTVPGAVVKMMEMSRGSLLGNQVAISAIYLGAAKQAYDFALKFTTDMKFKDSGLPIASSPFHQELIGKMSVALETARLWLLRQLELESSDPPLLSKEQVIMQWRMAKGVISESAYEVAQLAMKMCGTSNTGNAGIIARMLRDISMSTVMAFPAERGRLEAAKTIVAGTESSAFSV